MERLEEALVGQNVYCIASGEKDNELRFYFYSKHVSREFGGELSNELNRRARITLYSWSYRSIEALLS